MNTAADFLSRLQMDPNEKIILKIKEDIPTKPMEVNIESTGIAQVEPVFFDTIDQQETAEKELWDRKEEARTAIPTDPPVSTVSCHCENDIHKDTTIVNIAQLTKPSGILIEQDSDPTLLKFKREMMGLLFDKQILLNDARYMHYSRNKKRIIIKDDILCQKYYNDLGEASHLQVLLPANHRKCYYNPYMEQLANTQAFQKRCKKSVRSTTSLQLQLTSEIGFVIANYAFTINA